MYNKIAFIIDSKTLSQKLEQCQKNYSAFLEKGWGLGKGKTSFPVKRSFSLPQEQSPFPEKPPVSRGVLLRLWQSLRGS